MKQVLIPLIVALIITIIGVLYFGVTLTKNNQTYQGADKVSKQAESAESETEKIENLLQKNNQVCNFIQADKTGEIKIKDNNIFTTLKMLSDAKTYNTIISSDKMYTWEQGTKNGIMLTKNPSKPAITKEFNNTLSPFIKDEKLECRTENILDSEFTPPSEISFLDLNQLIK